MSIAADDKVVSVQISTKMASNVSQMETPQYRLYRQRFLGLTGFVSGPFYADTAFLTSWFSD
jgi:hypothetical protein